MSNGLRQVYGMQRQIVDLQNAVANSVRKGKIFDVKFDKDKKRWYCRLREGVEGEKNTFETDWLPWQTFANGAISISNPPRKGQMGIMHAYNGQAELGHITHYHNDPDNKSPHDKEDEYFMRVVVPKEDGKEQDDKNKILNVHHTGNGSTVSIGDSTRNITKDGHAVKTKNNSVDTETHTTKASKSHVTETGERTVKASKTSITSGTYSLTGKTLINC
jgi:phage baseplate assembly protein gpV